MSRLTASHLQVLTASHLRGTSYISGGKALVAYGVEVVMAGAARYPKRRSKPDITLHGVKTAPPHGQAA